jgi:hypothetical protein
VVLVYSLSFFKPTLGFKVLHSKEKPNAKVPITRIQPKMLLERKWLPNIVMKSKKQAKEHQEDGNCGSKALLVSS